MKRILMAFTVFALTGHAALDAQSLFSAAGLGLPVDPLDGRTRALGNVGVGLLGPEAGAVTVKTQAEVDALPTGATFIWTDGKQYTKD